MKIGRKMTGVKVKTWGLKGKLRRYAIGTWFFFSGIFGYLCFLVESNEFFLAI